MVEWNGIFQLFRFSGILGQPREVHPKFRKEIPENVCSIRSSTRNFRNFWSNGKRPSLLVSFPIVNEVSCISGAKNRLPSLFLSKVVLFVGWVGRIIKLINFDTDVFQQSFWCVPVSFASKNNSMDY